MGEALELFNKRIKKLALKDSKKYNKFNKKEGAVTKKEIVKTYNELLEKFKSDVPQLIQEAEKRIDDNIKESAGVKSTILQEVNMFQTKTKKIINKFDEDTRNKIKTIHTNFKKLIADNYGLATMKTLKNRVKKALDTFSETKKLYIDKHTACNNFNDLPIKNDNNSCHKFISYGNFISYMKKLAGEDETISDNINIKQENLNETETEIQKIFLEIQNIKSENRFPKKRYETWMKQGGDTAEQQIINAYKVIRLFNLYFDKNKKFIFNSDIKRKQKAKKALKFGLAAPFVAILVCILSPLILIGMLDYAANASMNKKARRR